MDYVGILKRAGSIAWRNKALWLFGFLVALSDGVGSNWNGTSSWTSNQRDWRGMEAVPRAMWSGLQANTWLLAVIILSILLFAVLAIFLNMVGNAALMGQVRDVEAGSAANIRRGFGIGLRRFWPYFGVNFVVSVPAALLSIGLVVLGMIPLLLTLARNEVGTAAGVGLTVVLMIPIMIFMVVLWSLLELLLEFFLRACVLEGKGVGASLSRGWDVFSANAWRSLAMAALLFGCGIVFALFNIPLVLGVLGVAALAGFATWGVTQAPMWGVAVGLALAVPGMLIVAFFGGVYKSFTSAAWTLAYLKMAGLEHAAVVAAPAPMTAGSLEAGPEPAGELAAGSQAG